jgi:hypothetical protein
VLAPLETLALAPALHACDLANAQLSHKLGWCNKWDAQVYEESITVAYTWIIFRKKIFITFTFTFLLITKGAKHLKLDNIKIKHILTTSYFMQVQELQRSCHAKTCYFFMQKQFIMIYKL